MQCDDCGEYKESIEEMTWVCSYDIYDELVECILCSECLEERAANI